MENSLLILTLSVAFVVYLLTRLLRMLTILREDVQVIGVLLAELLEQPDHPTEE